MTIGLHVKLAKVYAEVARIPKNGTAPAEMGGFRFVQSGDAADPIRTALGALNLTMLPTLIEVTGQSEHEDSRQRIVTTIDLRVSWTITDGDGDQSIVIQSMGCGSDRGDKYIPKALTNAMKYAILFGFLMPTGDDPELSESSERKAPRRVPATVTVATGGSGGGVVPEGDEPPQQTADGGLIGTVAIAEKWLEDALVRDSVGVPVLGFRIKQGRQSMKVQTAGPMALALGGIGPAELQGQTVTVWGHTEQQEYTPKGYRAVEYPVMMAERVKGQTFEIPAPGLSPEDEKAVNEALGLV